MTGGGELLITARRFRTQDANRSDARRRLAEMIAAAHIVQPKRKATRPSRAAKAQRVETEAQAQRGQANPRKGDGLRLMYDFKIEAGDTATLYRDLASALEGLVARRARPDRQHGQCRGVDLGEPARPQLGRLLPQRRRRAGARPVPGPPGVHPHPVRPGRVRRGRRDPAGPADRRRPRLRRPHRLRRRVEQRAGGADRARRRAARRARPRQPQDRAVHRGG